jgi:ferrochelatase
MKKKGILLVNLGTPAEAKPKAVRRYLAEFLDDPRVIDLPNIIRKILLYGFILPFRPCKTAKAYAQIFDPIKGSPLLYYSQSLEEKLQNVLGKEYVVALGMRYGDPKLTNAIEYLETKGCQEIIALPLFAQYSSAVNGSAIEAIFNALKKKTIIPSFRWISEFYQENVFLNLQAEKIRSYLLNRDNKNRAVVFSYHSLPVRQIKKSSQHCEKTCFQDHPCHAINEKNVNCYRAKCFQTSRELAHRLGLQAGEYHTVFQSRLGRTAWIGPEFISVLHQLREADFKSLIVACPSFVVDCLETLEEIGIRGQEAWKALGGEELTLVPSLNDDDNWAQALSSWLNNI